MSKRFFLYTILSFTLLFSFSAQAGLKSKIGLLIGTKVLISAVKNPYLQAKVIASITKNPNLKQKAIDNLNKIISNPKYINIKKESEIFLSKIEKIKVPKNNLIKPPQTGPPTIPTIAGRIPINSKYA